SAAIESQMLAYGGLDHIASAIAGAVCSNIQDPIPPDPKPQDTIIVPRGIVVIYDQASFASLQSYEAFIANAKAMVSLYETLLTDDDKKALNKKLKDAAKDAYPDRPEPRALGLSGTIDPFSDATSLLSAIAIASNTESAGSIVIPDSAMAVALTRELRTSKPCLSKKLTVIYPPLFGNSSATDFSSADIDSDLQKLQDVRDFVVHAVSDENEQWIEDHTGTSGTQNGNTAVRLKVEQNQLVGVSGEMGIFFDALKGA
ncbi:MAG TPA: hypothetical protein VKH63_23485, partial [Candidatus Acidoferrum sp.]|nr:hypothetical protein [Candidatus Acidoferrum sp.]